MRAAHLHPHSFMPHGEHVVTYMEENLAEVHPLPMKWILLMQALLLKSHPLECFCGQFLEPPPLHNSTPLLISLHIWEPLAGWTWGYCTLLHKVWGLWGEKPRLWYTTLQVCAESRKTVHFMLILNSVSQPRASVVWWAATLFVCLFPFLRQNVLQTALKWATAPSISSTGWTTALWQWGLLTSCLPVCPLSTCTTTQTLPHCL